MLSSEISNRSIKKKGPPEKSQSGFFFGTGSVFADLMGDWKQLEIFHSDGRPILGLDARDLA
jgi:hypothetical protein